MLSKVFEIIYLVLNSLRTFPTDMPIIFCKYTIIFEINTKKKHPYSKEYECFNNFSGE